MGLGGSVVQMGRLKPSGPYRPQPPDKEVLQRIDVLVFTRSLEPTSMSSRNSPEFPSDGPEVGDTRRVERGKELVVTSWENVYFPKERNRDRKREGMWFRVGLWFGDSNIDTDSNVPTET